MDARTVTFKVLAVTLLFTTASAALLTPLSVSGQAAVITVPGSVTTTNPPAVKFLSMDWIMKWIVNPAVRVVIRSLLQATTNQIVAWIQGEKNVGYVKNIEQAFRRQADIAGGEFLNKLTGINLCGNIGVFLRITLRTPPLRQQLACTVTDIVRNVETFFRDFENGGWRAFIKISVEPQNNPYGAYLIALDNKIAAEARAKEGLLEPLRKSYPFKGFQVPVEKCEIGTIDVLPEEPVVEQEEGELLPEEERRVGPSLIPGGGRQRFCHTEYETKTPGELISDTLSKSVGSGIDFGVHAKDFDEAIATIINALLNKLISSSGGLISGSAGGVVTEPAGEFFPGEQPFAGIFDPLLRERSQEDLLRNPLAQNVSEGLFRHDAALSALDRSLENERKELFATWQQIRELDLRGAPPESLERQELERDAAERQARINSLLTTKDRVLLAGADLARVLNAFTSADPNAVAGLAQNLSNALVNITNAAIAVPDVATPPAPSGDPRADTLTALRGAEVNVASALILIDDTRAETERAASAGLTPERSSEARTKLAAERAALQKLLETLNQHQQNLEATRDETKLKQVIGEVSTFLVTADREIQFAMITVREVDLVLAP